MRHQFVFLTAVACLASTSLGGRAFAQDGKAEYVRLVQFNNKFDEKKGYELSLAPQDGKPAPPIVVGPGAIVIIDISKPGSQPYDAPVWADTWRQQFKWEEERRDGKNTRKITFRQPVVRARTVQLGKENISLNVLEVAAGSAVKETAIKEKTTKIRIEKPAQLDFRGLVSASPPPFDKPRGDAQEEGGPTRVKTADSGVWYELKITVIAGAAAPGK